MVRQRKALLGEIVAGGDTGEKHYLDIRRQLVFYPKEEIIKIAKFIHPAGMPMIRGQRCPPL
ncbi:hypothetical protein OCL88_20390 [Paenarthrobacter sp. PAE-2]|jgi:hypothetical protein|uniref:hypothetical protein n=1 Tax=Paenarthrobacter sp. PAE-2 TaxID=2982532 RepID=UPI00222E0A52|nr:hypothetical protein [Paenarthrobacter sp. PAE-2]MCW3768838.1 hypothetical protein [Paenarthrobacter sp. PAE-2]